MSLPEFAHSVPYGRQGLRGRPFAFAAEAVGRWKDKTIEYECLAGVARAQGFEFAHALPEFGDLPGGPIRIVDAASF